MKTYTATVKLFEQNPGTETRKQRFKACSFDLYYKNSYLECYRFCQQCKENFENAKTNEVNQISFAALFFQRIVV